jgi:predicted metal-dependent hydrolase
MKNSSVVLTFTSASIFVVVSTSERDRDERGRPRNARPRDELGRPLPRDAEGSFVEEQLPSDPAELLRIGADHFNARRFFQAHEAWETAWHPAPENEREFWKGMTQIAVGFTHYQRGNPAGAQTLLDRGARKLEAYGESFRGVPVAELARAAHEAVRAIAAGETPEFPTIELEPDA